MGIINKMHTLAVVILVVLIILMLLSFPLSIKVLIYSNLTENANFLCIKLFGLFYICKKIDIQNGELILTATSGKKQKLEIKLLSKFQNTLLKEIAGQIGIDFLLLTFTFGSKDDAFRTAKICSGVYFLFSELKVFLSLKKDVVISYKIGANYNEDKLTLTTSAKLYFSILDLIFAFIKSIFKSIGERKNGEKQQSNQ